MKNTYLTWTGQTASTGTPNQNTGLMSRFGDIQRFSSKKERDEYCNTYNTRSNCYPTPTNKKLARQYFLGMSVENYLDHMKMIEMF